MSAKYRVVKRSGVYPYKVEKKTFIFWYQIDQENSFERAKDSMVRMCESDNKIPNGTVLATYTLEDLTADTLRGRK